MKRILSTLTLLLCFAFTAVNAQVITVERAAEIANSFFSAGVQKSGAARGVVASSGLTASFDSNDVTETASANPTFYVLTNPEGGFVIVSGEETENPIIGYSFDGTIDANNLPDGFVDYMTDIDAQVRALREYNAANPQKTAAARSAMQRAANFEYNATTMGEIVVDLKTAPWGQHGPFNKLCPVINGVNALTGCVPTAFAILCHYHKWPENGSGTYTNSGQTIDISTSTYDYASMRNDNYPSGQYTEAEANAVALLMRDLGFAYRVLYGTSSTDKSENATTLKSAFSYKSEYNPSGSGMDAMWRGDVEDATFIASLKECLDKKRPIPFSSKSIDPETGEGSIRHIFILDGYTKDNYFHFNYGWAGSGNGWYTIDFMQPDEESDYSTQQRAYLDLIPNRTPRTVTASVSPAGAGTVTVNDNANSAEVTEGTYATLKAIANNGYTFSHWSKDGAQVSTEKTYKALVAAEGNDYVANFLTVGNTRVNVSVSYNSSYGTVTYNSNAVSGTGITPYQNSEVTLVATPLDGYVFNGWTVTKGTNSTNYAGTELTFVATGDMSVEANFSTAIATYYISEATGTLENSTSTRYTTWSSREVSGLCLTASYNSNAVEAISFNSGQVKLISAVSVEENYQYVFKNPVTYTLSAPDGYVITGYSMTYKSSGSNYAMTIANEQMSQTLANRNEVLTLSATGLSAQNTSFTVSGVNTNYAIQVQEFTVTLQSEGGGSTPTPTTYTIYATAGEGGSVTINGDAVSQKSVNENSTVTLVATPQAGYRFVNWTDANNGSEVSTSATYSYTATSNKSLVANFEQTQYTVTVAAGEGGVAYIGTKGTTERTVSHNENVTITAEANDGYRFVEWRAWNNHFSSNAQQDVTVTTDVTYTAVFEAEAQEPEQPTVDPLAGKYFRLKTTVNSAVKYMNVGTQSDNSHGNVNMVDLNETSDDQIFLFEQSGDGYKLKARSGNYIKCAEWNVNANTTNANEASVLLFEESGDGYLIKWNNTYKNGGTIKYFNIQAAKAGDRAYHPYSDGDYNAAATWVLEEVRILTVTYSCAAWNNEASGWWVSVVTNTTPAVTVKTTDGTPKIGFSTFNDVRHPYLLDGNSFTISLPANCKITGYRLGYQAHNLVSKSVTYTNGKESTGIVTIAQSDEQNTLTVTGLDNNEISFSVEDQSSQAGFIIKSLEITYVEEEFTPLPFKAEIENWRNDNPNTHLGTITIGGTPMKLTPEHLTASELTMPLAEGTTLAFTRKYRGFEFNGFYIGEESLGTNPTLTADNVAAISDETPLVAKFTATDDVTLFYDDDEFSYRIPAIVKTVKDEKHKLIAISDYRHSFDDIGRDNHKTGTTQVDLVIRTSEDNGATWTAKQTIAEGSQHFGYGDAAAVANGQDVLVMAVAGNVFYAYADSENPQQAYRIYSNDNGVTWEKEDISSNMESLFPDYHGLFFGSGKLVVDPDFNGSGNARVYGAILMKDSQGERNYVLYSDNWGKTWNILGNAVPARQNEPKVEILPNGQILLSARRGGGRTFNVFTYTDKASNAGTWSTAANGCDNGGNATNGEIICLDAKRPNGKLTKILLQSQPYGGDRRNVSIWYKEISANETYTASSIASGWTMGKQVSTQLSAYSAMCLQENGEIALFFEEAPCYGDDHTKGYSMVYVPLTIEEITKDNFLNPNAVVEPVTVDVTLTDNEGNTYTHQFDYLPGDAAAIDAALMTAYPFITELGENGNLEQTGEKAYTYTNTVTLPFKVSNANTTVWHNIYYPSNNTVGSKPGCPNYIAAFNNNDDVVDMAASGGYAYGANPTYNTKAGNPMISWAVYSVNNSFEFVFKNELTNKYIKVGSVSTETTANVSFVDNAGDATAFTLLADTGGHNGDYALVAKVGDATGYLCATSSSKNFVTYFSRTNHEGAWVKFVEAPDYQGIYDKLIADINNFGDGEGKYTANDAISSIDKDALAAMLFSDLTAQATAVQTVKDSYTEITLTVPVANSGSVNIASEENVSHKFVPKGNVTIEAVPAAGYRFVNWTRPAAQASAAARTAVARSGEVVSEENPYTVTVSEALSLEANFEEIVVNATLTDAQSNTYNVQLSGFTTEITKETVAAKLREAYPYITLGTVENVITLNGSNGAYTYTNTVELPFKVSNASYIWHNIYWPSNTRAYDYPIYWAASSAEDTYVPKVTGSYAYGAHPTYNTKDGGNSICWAIYNVNNGFEFIFKNKVTQKYIKVTSVANGGAQNVVYVENAEDATAFTIEKKPAGNDYYTPAQYALAAYVGETKGYLCSTSATDNNYATHYQNNTHQGAWIEFVEAPDYQAIINQLIADIDNFGAGEGKYVANDAISNINKNALATTPLNTLNTHTETVQTVKDSYTEITLTVPAVNDVVPGSVKILGEEVSHKFVPKDEITIQAVPAEGYHFVSWTDGTSEISTVANYTFNITAATALTANFAKNSYNVSVTAGEGGSASAGAATVEHGASVTLTATPSAGYSFAGWFNGEELVSSNAEYTVTNVTRDINYTARFEEVVETPTTVAIKIVTVDTDDNALANNDVVKAIIGNVGDNTCTAYDFVKNADVKLVATNDYNQQAYLFDGWYKNDVLVNNELEITVQATEVATYEARFFKGCIVIGNPNNNRFGYISSITLADGTSIGYDASNRAVVKAGTTVKFNTFINMYGYEVGSWTNANDEIVSTDKDFIVEVNEDVTYTANFEPASYNLTVRANIDERGTVSAESVAGGSGTEIIVGHNMEATITASPYPGHRFVKWTTTDGTYVSDEKTYTVPAIEKVEDMVDVEYVAVFEEIGTYYRIAYDFEVPVAAKSAATRAAGDVVNIDLTTGTFEGLVSGEGVRTIYSQWLSANGVRIIAEDKNNNEVTAMRSYNGFQLYINSLESLPIKYTIIVPEGYTLTSMKFKNGARANDMTVVYGSETYSLKNDATEKTITFTEGNTSFTLSGTVITKNILITALTMTENGSETPEPETETVKYYVQSEACGVSGKENALKMTTVNDNASSIFYCVGNKLMSYAKGTYVNENGNTRGLQNVGVEGGEVTFESDKIKFTNGTNVAYMHAKESNGIYYVDNCGATATCGNDDHNFIFEEVESLPVTISAAGYASWYAPVAVSLPSGIEAWYFDGKIGYKGEDKYAIMAPIGGDVVPANTGVILTGKDGKPAENGIYYLAITDEVDPISGNKLEGTVATEYVDKGKAYVLSKQNGKIGFYWATTAGQQENVFLNNSHKAYLPASNLPGDALQSAGFRFSFGGTTDIEEVETESSEVNAIYDLTGRKLEGISGTGIYIINGKKVLIK